MINNQQKIDSSFKEVEKIFEKVIEIAKSEDLAMYENTKLQLDQFKSRHFKIAVIGEFSTGKSTFLNAILGNKILSVALEECTSVVTYLSESKDQDYHYHLLYPNQENIVDQKTFEHAISFKGNSDKTLKMAKVFIPNCSLLKNNVHLIDTPGINDPHLKGEQITLKWLPEADAIIFLTHCERAFKESELLFLKERVSKQDRNRFIFVINASDLIEDEEDFDALNDRFTENLSKDYPNQKLHFISSTQALLGKLNDNEKLLKSSNIDQFYQSLNKLLFEDQAKIQLDHWMSIAETLKEKLLGKLQLELKSYSADTELHERMVSRVQYGLQVIEDKKRYFEKYIDQYMQDHCSNKIHICINTEVSNIRHQLNQLSGDENFLKLKAEQIVSDSGKKILSMIHSQLRLEIHHLHQDLLKQIQQLLGDVDSEFSNHQMIIHQNPKWEAMVQVSSYYQEISTKKYIGDSVSTANINDTISAFGLGAFIGAALLGPLGFIAGGMFLSGLVGGSTTQQIYTTIKEKVLFSQLNIDDIVLKLTHQLTSTSSSAIMTLAQQTKTDLNAVLMQKIEELNSRLDILTRKNKDIIFQKNRKENIDQKIKLIEK
jgi:GTPase Era involved in 16S rRNA processing